VEPGVLQLLPDLFFKAADLAGVYGVAVLYGVLPPIMVWLLRLQQVLPVFTVSQTDADVTSHTEPCPPCLMMASLCSSPEMLATVSFGRGDERNMLTD
jgi:hypothetical protein